MCIVSLIRPNTSRVCLCVLEGLDGEAGGHREMMDVLGGTVMAMLNKYWIYICSGMFFFVSFEGRIVMYKILYMMMFLFCVALYQVCAVLWFTSKLFFFGGLVFVRNCIYLLHL